MFGKKYTQEELDKAVKEAVEKEVDRVKRRMKGIAVFNKYADLDNYRIESEYNLQEGKDEYFLQEKQIYSGWGGPSWRYETKFKSFDKRECEMRLARLNKDYPEKSTVEHDFPNVWKMYNEES